jgi:hypothetical protein
MRIVSRHQFGKSQFHGIVTSTALLAFIACAGPSSDAEQEDESEEQSSETSDESSSAITSSDEEDTGDEENSEASDTPSDPSSDEAESTDDVSSEITDTSSSEASSESDADSDASSGDDESESEQSSDLTQDESSESDSSSGEDDADANVLQLVISVDWEGMQISESNLAVMESFRDDFPEVPITHFLNAAYFTKPDADGAQIVEQTRRVLRDHDELGLHIHGWQSLFEASGVTFRTTPTFWGSVSGCEYDCGHQVAISAYSTEELRRVIAFSLDELESHGFGRATSFRSGGWMGRANVLEALAAEGIERDNSAVATVFFDDEAWQVENLYAWLTELWAGITRTSQPYRVTTPAGEILEIPDNGALADYVTGDEMLEVYQACLAYKRAHPQEHVTLNFGFHHETAQSYVGRVEDGLRKIYAAAEADGVRIEAVTTQEMRVSN